MTSEMGDSKGSGRREGACLDMMLGPAIALAGWMAGLSVSYGSLSGMVQALGWAVKIGGVVVGAGLLLRGLLKWRG